MLIIDGNIGNYFDITVFMLTRYDGFVFVISSSCFQAQVVLCIVGSLA